MRARQSRAPRHFAPAECGRFRVVSSRSAGVSCGVSLLHFRDLGGEGKPPLVVLHGLLGSSRNWQSAGADLCAHAHVFALDLRNHGRSFHDSVMNYPAMALDVFRWAQAQGLGSFALMGHSMGGKVAMRMAMDDPERVSRLIVVDIAPKAYLSNAHRNEFAGMNELDLRTLASRADAELRLEGRVPDWAMRKFLVTNLEREAETNRWRWTVNLPVLTAELPALEGSPLYPGEQYTGSVLFLRGGRSSYVIDDDLGPIRQHFPKAVLQTIAESGHNPHMETRPAFSRLVADFLNRA